MILVGEEVITLAFINKGEVVALNSKVVKEGFFYIGSITICYISTNAYQECKFIYILFA